MERVVIHALAAAGAARHGLHLSTTHVPAVGPIEPLVADIAAPPSMLAEAEHGLPAGAARAEAVAVRLRRSGAVLRWGSALELPRTELLRRSAERGRSSVEILRADPSLLCELQVGGWFNAGPRGRLLRRVLLCVPAELRRWAPVRLAADAAFWSGVRASADATEWRRISRSSYTALSYHRVAGEGKPGQERLDLSPRTFRRQLVMLRLAGYRPLAPDELLRFHFDARATLPRRRYVMTTDDAFADCVQELRRHLRHRPQIYVPTAAVGGAAIWADGEPVAGWPQLRALAAAGAIVGSHTRTHASLPALDDERLGEELGRSRADVEGQVGAAADLLAYPHGRHDARVRDAARLAGYRLAWSTDTGRNGAGTDPYCLRRVGPKDWHGPLAALYVAVAGTYPPRWWEARLSRRVAASAARRAHRHGEPGSR